MTPGPPVIAADPVNPLNRKMSGLVVLVSLPAVLAFYHASEAN